MANARHELLGTSADQKMMVGVVHHGLRGQRRRAHALERAHTARALPRAVHAARVELHDAVLVVQASVPDTGLLRIQLRDVDARDQRVGLTNGRTNTVGASGDVIAFNVDDDESGSRASSAPGTVPVSPAAVPIRTKSRRRLRATKSLMRR